MHAFRGIIVALFLLAGVWLDARAGESDVDPLEKINRAVFAFNEELDRWLIRPVAVFYRDVTPQPLQKAVRNFLSNLQDPWVGVNNLLQGKLADACSDWLRFGVNTTFGLLGFLDIASELGLVKHNEDFGQTLAVWGVARGPYLVLPLLGPSVVGDALGLVLDQTFYPLNQVEDLGARRAGQALRLVAARSDMLDADEALRAQPDRYAWVRAAYLQRRFYLIHDGNPPLRYEPLE